MVYVEPQTLVDKWNSICCWRYLNGMLNKEVKTVWGLVVEDYAQSFQSYNRLHGEIKMK